MTDLAETVRLTWLRADSRYPALDPEAPADPKARGVYAAERVLAVLADPEHRAALVAWLESEGIAVSVRATLVDSEPGEDGPLYRIPRGPVVTGR